MGHPVIVNFANNREAADAVVDSICSNGGEAEAMQFDVADQGATATAIELLLTDKRPISVIVNNAAPISIGVFATAAAIIVDAGAADAPTGRGSCRAHCAQASRRQV
mgnify:CR=1 FL=1